MARHSTTVALAVFALVAAVALAADWKTAGSSISPMSAGGILLYVTQSKGGLVLAKSLKPTSDVDASKPPKPPQSFTFEGKWPEGQFSLVVNGFYVNADGPNLKLVPKTAGGYPSLWIITPSGQIKAADSDLALDVTKVVVGGALVLRPSDKQSLTQKWIFSPSGNPPVFFTGLIVSLDPSYPQPMCLDATGITTAGISSNPILVKDAPKLSPCDPAVPGQIFKARGVVHPKDPHVGRSNSYYSNFPNLFFDIYSQANGLCLVTENPLISSYAGRDPVNLGMASCAHGSVKPTNAQQYYSFWAYNSRGQIQSDMQVFAKYSTQAEEVVLPICLQGGTTAAPGDCSLRSYKNRWQFMYAPSFPPKY